MNETFEIGEVYVLKGNALSSSQHNISQRITPLTCTEVTTAKGYQLTYFNEVSGEFSWFYVFNKERPAFLRIVDERK